MLPDAGRIARSDELPNQPLTTSTPLPTTARRAVGRASTGRLTLRVALLSLLILLLVFAIGAIVAVTTYTISRSTQDLQGGFFSASAAAISSETRRSLQPGPQLLAAMLYDVQSGALDVANQDRLTQFMANRVRSYETVAWISYSDAATGRFAGTWRRADGQIIFNRSSPTANNGIPEEFVLRADGTLEPYPHVLKAYDPRTQPFFNLATAVDDIVWTEPYAFNEGRYGITSALALRDRTSGRVRGVFTVDFSLDYISAYMTKLARGEEGTSPAAAAGEAEYVVASRDGTVIAHSDTWPLDRTQAVTAAAAATLPGGLGGLRAGDSAPFVVEVGGVRYAGAFNAFENRGGLILVSGSFMPEDEFLQAVHANERQTLLLGGLFLALSILLGALVANRIAGPLRLIAADVERVGHFEIDPKPSPGSFVKEVAVVGEAVDRMKASLRSFSRYVPVQLVQELVASGREARLEGETRALTIYFSDVEGFTQISEHLSPQALVAHLGLYFEAMTAVIEAEQGTIDKFMGDGVLALFNAPRPLPDHAVRACRAALHSQRRLEELRSLWQAQGRPAFKARIGLHTGEALVGNIGAPDRFAYTVIGDVVNLASRLEGLNKQYGSYILASEETRREAGPGFEWRTLDRVAVIGRSGGTPVSGLLGEVGTVSPGLLAARDLYEQALRAYFARDFAVATAGFRAAATARPWDKAALLMEYRAERFAETPPPEDWDGIYHATEK